MARERMITRTITETTATTMCVNIVKGEVVTVDYVLTGDYKNNEDIMKYLKKNYEDDTFKIVNIQNVETVEKLYGMSEKDFIYHAYELPARQ